MAKKILIIYYSDTGNTEKVAQYIANETAAVVEAIDTPVFGKGIWNYMKRAWYALRKKMVPIDQIENDPTQFDLVIVGSPVWAGHVSNPVRAFLTTYSKKTTMVAFFVTLGGSGAESALQDMREISGMDPAAELVITDKDRKTKQDIAKLNYFINNIKEQNDQS